MTNYALTPSQTVGPFLHLALAWPDGPDVVAPGTAGRIVIGGTVRDGAGEPLSDALVETWQADGDGRFDAPGFRGFGRCPTDRDGRWAIRTVKPGTVPSTGGRHQAPHIAVSVFARGLLDRLVTRLYFADEEEANAADPVLVSLPDDAARATLVAPAAEAGYRFDIRLQSGPGDGAETVFFAL